MTPNEQNHLERIVRLEERQDALLRELSATREQMRELGGQLSKVDRAFQQHHWLALGIVLTVSALWGALFTVWSFFRKVIL